LKVAIIGGGGRMGSWFARYFSSKGVLAVLSDTRIKEAGDVAYSTGAEVARTNIEAVRDTDVVLVCGPIDKIRDVIMEIAPHMKRGSILVELSSIKGQAMEAFREIASVGIKPLSIHPLFGPMAESLKDKTIVVVPVVDADMEAGLARKLFEEAEIVISEQEEHNRVMAIVLSLTYFTNLAFAKILSEEDLFSLKRLSGTTFTVQLALTESVVSEDLDLVKSLLKENRFTERYIDRFISEAKAIRRLMSKNYEGFDKLHNNLKSSLSRDPDYSKADDRRYRAFSALRR